MKSEIESLVRTITQNQSFVLTTHVNPDGDGIGSEIALGLWLTSLGKEVAILNDSPTPSIYHFMDPDKRIRRYDEQKHRSVIDRADLIIVLDTNHPARLRSMEQAVTKSRATKVCIDHHLEPAPFADRYFIDDTATSTGELVYRLLMAAGVNPLPADIAQALYCAILTDTGSFRYSHIDPETHRIVATLVESGAEPTAIYREVYEQWTPGRIRLLGETLESLGLEYGGALAHVTIDQSMLKRTGTVESDTDNFTTYPMSIAGVRAGILFLELERGVKMSLRSRGDLPINELAKEFGGGGHRNAAGAQMTDRQLQEFKTEVIQAARKYV